MHVTASVNKSRLVKVWTTTWQTEFVSSTVSLNAPTIWRTSSITSFMLWAPIAKLKVGQGVHRPPPWTDAGPSQDYFPPTMSPVPIYTPGWRQTKWNKGSLSKKTTRRAMLEPRTSRSGVQGVNRYATHASMHIPDRGKPYQRLKRLNSILFLWAYNVSASIVKRNLDAWRKGRIL